MSPQIIKEIVYSLASEYDIVKIRRLARDWAVNIQLSVVAQTKLMTAASELARNIFHYATVGNVQLQIIQKNEKKGIRMIFKDSGPGITDLNLAMKDGFSTGGSLGMGLGGTKRLVDEFEISSKLNHGTYVSIIIWK